MKKNKVSSSLTFLCVGVAAIIVLIGCKRPKENKITGTTAKVTEVIDGRTIKLSNNLKVKLLGVEKNADTKKFLERNVKGKRVKLVADSFQNHCFYQESISPHLAVYGCGRSGIHVDIPRLPF